MDTELRDLLVHRLRGCGASPEDAEDCAQEAMTAAWLASRSGAAPENLAAWATTVARRRYVDLVRREARHRRLGREATDDEDRTAPTPEARAVEREHAAWLVGNLTRLPRRTEEVCRLSGPMATRSAIAGQLGLTDRAVESHLTRARRLLRTLAALVWSAVTAGVHWARREPASLVTVGAAATVLVLTGPGLADGARHEPRTPVTQREARPSWVAEPVLRVQGAKPTHRTGTWRTRQASRPPGPLVVTPVVAVGTAEPDEGIAPSAPLPRVGTPRLPLGVGPSRGDGPATVLGRLPLPSPAPTPLDLP